MKKNKILSFLITAIIFIGCSPHKSKTIEVTEIGRVQTKSISLSKDTLYTRINISCYEIIDNDTILLSPIKILNIDSLKSKIKYPDIAERAGVEGNVLIELKFNDNDEIVDMKPVSNIGASLEESVMNSIKDFKFRFDDNVGKRNVSILLIVDFFIVNSRYRVPFLVR